jgi:hypothetical protein
LNDEIEKKKINYEKGSKTKIAIKRIGIQLKIKNKLERTYNFIIKV